MTSQDEILGLLRRIDAKFDRLLDALIAHATPLPPLPEAPPTELEYAVTIKPVRDGGYVALVPDLPGCIAGGATREAALAKVPREIKAWIDAATTAGLPVPPPSL